jgi:hypothetical protein
MDYPNAANNPFDTVYRIMGNTCPQADNRPVYHKLPFAGNKNNIPSVPQQKSFQSYFRHVVRNGYGLCSFHGFGNAYSRAFMEQRHGKGCVPALLNNLERFAQSGFGAHYYSMDGGGKTRHYHNGVDDMLNNHYNNYADGIP